jgi:hypothetical protein
MPNREKIGTIRFLSCNLCIQMSHGGDAEGPKRTLQVLQLYKCILGVLLVSSKSLKDARCICMILEPSLLETDVGF